jgi:YegS/Rv2252/BmrU family lipid kinase
VTTRAGEARELAAAAAAAGCELVLSVGGDGTANEVAWGLLGTDVMLGLVPVGSGNGLARTLGIPLDPSRAVPLLARSVGRRMDLGFVNDRPFLNVAGSGFDAAVGDAFQKRGKEGGRRGVFTYVRLGFREAFRYRATHFRIEGGTLNFAGPAFLVALVNGRQYGGGAVIAPRARLDDGILNVVVIEECSLPEALWHARRLFTGSIEGFRRYRHFAVEGGLTISGDGPLAHYRDGEPEEPAPRLDVRLEARALRILVTPDVAEDPDGPFRSRSD